MGNESNWILMSRAFENRKAQIEAVYSALLKLDMMGLTLPSGMVECPPPQDIDPFRWKAMLNHAINNPEAL